MTKLEEAKMWEAFVEVEYERWANELIKAQEKVGKLEKESEE